MSRIVRGGDVAFDIGANVGLHTALLSKLVGPAGRVFVFEPNQELTPALDRTVRACGNARLLSYALSDCTADATLFVPENPEMACLADWTTGRDDVPHARGVACQLRRLDDLLESEKLPRPDFIKCDVEGAELLVFRGATKILNSGSAPVLLFEASIWTAPNLGFKATDVFDFLTSLPLPDYQFFSLNEHGSLAPLKVFSSVEHENVLAVPAARRERLAM